MFDRRFNSSIRSCSVAFYNHYFQNTEHDVKNPRKDSLSECEIYEGFRNTLFVQSGRSNRCRLRSQFKPPITAVDYGLGRDSGDNNKGMATVPGPWRASVEHHHAAPGLPPSARSSPGFTNCVDSHIRNRPWSLLCVYQAGLGGHPHPPDPPFARARSLRLRHQL
jgi:hypothetical protein